MAKCNQDCFNCPHPDCILSGAEIVGNASERNRKYYQEHREELRKKRREQYLRRKEAQRNGQGSNETVKQSQG